jgi:hypothetical protein
LLRAIGIGLSEKSKEETGRELLERMAPVPELIFLNASSHSAGNKVWIFESIGYLKSGA